ncbi:hypothetical protein I7I51_01251 [Histoplasma capsulatum]|uniref:Uncharacterized protein n=1 Tax=Ajellomyces capsulatus TaxID=5037 RepID=A0A8A1MCG4_AJECA|nr:hypothetical protein I7I51_01251 [Histoplasma capsulatum]
MSTPSTSDNTTQQSAAGSQTTARDQSLEPEYLEPRLFFARPSQHAAFYRCTDSR